MNWRADHERDVLAVRRPYRHADGLGRVTLEGDLAHLTAVQFHDPKITVAAAVRKIDHLFVARPDRRSLRLSCLMCDLHRTACVLNRRAIHRIFPNVEVHLHVAGNHRAGLIEIWVDIGALAESQLPWLASRYSHGPEIEAGQVEHRCAER